MTRVRASLLGISCAILCAPQADALDASFNGYADVRLVIPPGDGSYLDGDLGKLRFGHDDGSPNVHFTEAVGEGHLLITPELTATATARVDPNYGPGVDLLDAWVRYRPVSTNAWIWSVKAGAFFPPMSLENDEIGWTSFWTLTPSALNSWAGSEIRILGSEATLQYRRDEGTLTLIGALYGWNQNAGEFIADRGFNLDDRPVGLFDKPRLPDAIGIIEHETPPLHEELFKQFDSNPGWYVDLSYEPEDFGGIELMRYDNDANPAAMRGGDTAWHTSFWDLGLNAQTGKLTLLAQGMLGTTVTGSFSAFRLDTNFRAAYLLAGIDFDAWWLALRFDAFQTRSVDFGAPPLPLSEDGRAATLSASVLPRKWLRLTSEFLVVQSTRNERLLTGDPASVTELQLQFSARVYL